MIASFAGYAVMHSRSDLVNAGDIYHSNMNYAYDPNWKPDFLFGDQSGWQKAYHPNESDPNWPDYKLGGNRDYPHNGSMDNLAYIDTHSEKEAIKNQLPLYAIGDDGASGNNVLGYYSHRLHFDFWIPTVAGKTDQEVLSDYVVDTFDLCHSGLDLQIDDPDERTAVWLAGWDAYDPDYATFSAAGYPQNQNFDSFDSLQNRTVKIFDGFKGKPPTPSRTETIMSCAEQTIGGNTYNPQYYSISLGSSALHGVGALEKQEFLDKANPSNGYKEYARYRLMFTIKDANNKYYNLFRARVRHKNEGHYTDPQHEVDSYFVQAKVDLLYSLAGDKNMTIDDGHGVSIHNYVPLGFKTNPPGNGSRMLLWKAGFLTAVDPHEEHACSGENIPGYLGLYDSELPNRRTLYRQAVPIKARLFSKDRKAFLQDKRIPYKKMLPVNG